MIQFPDPHFKKKHRKRRIFQPDLVKAICDLLPPGGQLFLQSDVKLVSSAMRNIFEMYAFDQFELAPQHSVREEDVFFSAQDDPTEGDPSGSPGGPSSNLPAGGEAGGTISSDDDLGRDDAEAGEEASAADSSEDYDNMVSRWAEAGWLRANPIGVPTEREHHVLQQGLPVYRVLLIRTDKK